VPTGVEDLGLLLIDAKMTVMVPGGSLVVCRLWLNSAVLHLITAFTLVFQAAEHGFTTLSPQRQCFCLSYCLSPVPFGLGLGLWLLR
jgi:hypothetical protein